MSDIVQRARSQFPALNRLHGDKPVIYLDGPAGTQVPQVVADAVQHAMLHHNANRSGRFETSREVDRLFGEAMQAGADWVGASDPEEIVFGPNMTTLNFAVSRAIANLWNPGDEIVVTRLDHDANVSPWILAARDRGCSIKFVEVDVTQGVLNEQDFAEKITPRTKLVAFTCASNSIGTLTSIRKLTSIAKQHGALVYLDAVHYAPHGVIDVQDWGCDFLVCSAYKFFGPHIGILWGKRELLESIEAYKVRPAPNSIPGKWMTGTQNHACLAGVTAAIDYVSNIVSNKGDRRSRLRSSFEWIVEYERSLIAKLIEGLIRIPRVKVYGLTSPDSLPGRVPTLAFTAEGWTSTNLAERLGNEGIFTWHGHYYAVEICRQLGCEPEGMLRMGLMHYNTMEEVDRTLQTVARILGE